MTTFVFLCAATISSIFALLCAGTAIFFKGKKAALHQLILATIISLCDIIEAIIIATGEQFIFILGVLFLATNIVSAIFWGMIAVLSVIQLKKLHKENNKNQLN